MMQSTIMAMNSNSRKIVLLLTLLSGLSGLIYEVTWQKYLSNLLGSQAKSNAMVLALFLGCLSLGYVFFGIWSKSKSARQLIRAYGFIELSIGLWTFVFLPVYKFFLNHAGFIESTSWMALPWEFLNCLLLIGMPTFLMGGTLPLLTQGFSVNLNKNSEWHSQVYGVNTGGAFLGATLAGFLLLPTLGLKSTLLIAASINILVGLFFLKISKNLSSKIFETQATGPVMADSNLKPKKAIVLAFISGFIALTLQILTMRTSGLVMGPSEYTFSMIVGAYILILALGATVRIKDYENTKVLWLNQTICFVGLVSVYILTPYLPFLFYLLRSKFINTRTSFYLYHAVAFIIYVLVLLIPIGTVGRTMPLLFSLTKKTVRNSGSVVGHLYGWNALGCVLGALVGGYLLFYAFNLDQIFKICLCLLLLSILMSTALRAHRFLLIVAAIAVLMLPDWNKSKMASGMFQVRNLLPITNLASDKILAYKDDPNTSVAIIGNPSSARIILDGKVSAGSSFEDQFIPRALAQISMMFSQEPTKKVAVVGFGGGATAGTFSRFDEVEKIDIIEISSGVKEFSSYFDAFDNRISKNPKVSWYIEDAYRFFSSSRQRYSVITVQAENIWASGVERLYSQEFYQKVNERLEPDGIFVQWLHLFDSSDSTVAIALNTFSSSFKFAAFYRLADNLFLAGSQTDLMERRHEMKNGEQILIDSQAFKKAPLHTLEFPQLSYRAQLDFFLSLQSKLNSLGN